MPELPEVETIRRQLSQVLPGKVFSSVTVCLPKQIRSLTAAQFKRQVVGTKIKSIHRRAKMLAIEINKGFIVFHLKMTGQIIYKAQEAGSKKQKLLGGGHPIQGSLIKLPNKYSHVFFTFRDGTKLFFNDTRQFGWVTIVTSQSGIESLSAIKLGPEPLTKNFNLEKFIECMKARPRSRVYQALLDQKCVVGVGNIYVSESLFVAGIKPTRRNKNIVKQEYKKLYNAIKKLLTNAIKLGGTSTSDYLDALGNVGRYVKKLKVYQKKGQKCPRKCGGVIKRLVIGSRSAFYCPKCQK